MSTLFITFRFLDAVDILLVAWLLYMLYNVVKGTSAIRIFLGILVIYIAWKLTEFLKMNLLLEIISQFIKVGVIALLIVFQQELRRFLLLIGESGFWRNNFIVRFFKVSGEKETPLAIDIEATLAAMNAMSKTKTGALIVIERTTPLIPYATAGVKLNAEVNENLLIALFQKESPLHDGAILVRANTIIAAKSILPISQSDEMDMVHGMRHRAALGISEKTDAIVLTVSEQNGAMSLFHNSTFNYNLPKENLRANLQKLLQTV